MRILVTGGAGFIGTNLIKRLVSQGHKVTSYDNYTTGKKENHITGCNYYDIDIATCIFEVDFDIVFHMAAIARIQPSFKNPKEYFNTNANGTLNISEYCSKNNIPLIYAGSSSHHSGKFKNPYTFSKDMGEDIIHLYTKHFGLKSFRLCFSVYDTSGFKCLASSSNLDDSISKNSMPFFFAMS